MRQPNSHECLYFGRKLSNICCDNIDVSTGYVVIGPERDDEISFDQMKNGDLIPRDDMIKERVRIILIHEPEYPEEGFYTEIDLEDVLRFAVKNCHGIYRRVWEEAGY